MAQELKVPPVSMTLHGPGKSKVEITIDGDSIWLSDWAEGSNQPNFTLKIARKALQTHDTAVTDLCKRGEEMKKAGRQNAPRSRDIDVGDAVSQSRKAGYWYVDSRYTMHGTPVTIVDG